MSERLFPAFGDLRPAFDAPGVGVDHRLCGSAAPGGRGLTGALLELYASLQHVQHRVPRRV
eukprot:8729328-Pyramimonas_sp.AAC.1